MRRTRGFNEGIAFFIFFKVIRILGSVMTSTKVLTLEALFIREFNPVMNTKEEYRSRVLTLKF